MKKRISIFIIIVTLAMISVLIYQKIVNTEKVFSYPKNGYLVATSNMLQDKSSIISINENGEIIESINLKARDLSFTSFSEKEIVISGQRSNDNIILDKNGSIQEIDFWKSENKTGTTSLAVKENKIFALMNIGYVDSVYENCLVIQNKDGKIYDEIYLKIVGSNMIIHDNYIIITGSEANSEDNTWYGKIIVYDYTKKEVVDEYVNKNYSEITDICVRGQDVYFIAKKLNVDDDSIVKSNLDLDTTDTVYQGSYISGLYIVDERILFTDNNELIGINMYNPNKILIRKKIIDSGYYSNSMLFDNKIVILMRNQDKQYNNGNVSIGRIIECSLDLNEIKSIELIVPEKLNADTFLILPNL